ncbi:MAG: tRNA guanosine(34) transglycosylase Tgt [Planctomycetota bacterium]|nr:MAG: tRNA guanosine(34) transglycosylase Tgt [Planctomycetota bacterium]
MSLRFELLSGTAVGPRRGVLHTARGAVPTPAFMPVATRGMMRGVPHDRLRPMGVDMVLCNAFHLATRPGVETVAALGGVHGMLAWDGPVLTDSGGFQVFSLAETCRIGEDGVRVEDPVHGGWIDWTPEHAFAVQAGLGPDVAMVLDHCPARPLERAEVEPAVARTLRWARIQRELHQARGGAASGQALFGIVQGGVFADLRRRCAEELVALDFDGYAVGGVSVGEDHPAMMRAVEASCAHLPVDRVRYLMGVGAPPDLVEAVARGIDLFDCVYPTRCGRFGTALTRRGRLHLLNARFRADRRPIDPDCPCPACRSGVPRGALRAGFKARELNPPILLAMHNLHFTVQLARACREAIAAGRFEELRREVAAAYPARGAS